MSKGVELSFTFDTNLTCPKCAGMILVDFTFFDKLFRRKKPKYVTKHIKNCKSTLVSDGAEKMAEMIEKDLMDELMKMTED